MFQSISAAHVKNISKEAKKAVNEVQKGAYISWTWELTADVWSIENLGILLWQSQQNLLEDHIQVSDGMKYVMNGFKFSSPSDQMENVFGEIRLEKEANSC